MISYSYQCWQRARVCRLHRSLKCLAHHCATATGDSPAKSNASTTRIVERLVYQSGTCRSCPWRVRYETTGGQLCVPDDLKLRAFASALQLGTQNHSAESRRVNNNLSELSGRRGDLQVYDWFKSMRMTYDRTGLATTNSTLKPKTGGPVGTNPTEDTRKDVVFRVVG